VNRPLHEHRVTSGTLNQSPASPPRQTIADIRRLARITLPVRTRLRSASRSCRFRLETITLPLWSAGSDFKRNEMCLTAFPRAPFSHSLCPSTWSVLTGSNSQQPVGLSTSAVRMPPWTISSPPASSIVMASDVPDRGSPDTTMIGLPYLSRRYILLSALDMCSSREAAARVRAARTSSGDRRRAGHKRGCVKE
jgi:hypothetical protein